MVLWKMEFAFLFLLLLVIHEKIREASSSVT